MIGRAHLTSAPRCVHISGPSARLLANQALCEDCRKGCAEHLIALGFWLQAANR